ncbi:uncharacterized protein LOC130998447 [Salvia miltiorrhiza]|uniref:uncharacterized protein LOC130998447 n=1 Tax=Salvia miltiorrhiza TaxID=226208 RepID=UPI0025ACBFDC|nr:uncharacterized protein LOC130998447 [Salvia miltiorrhiza]
MENIREAKFEAYQKLMTVGLEKWAQSKCPVRRYSCLTSNAAESFNGRLLWARRLPICLLIEGIRMVIEKWFDERHEAAKSIQQDITPEAHRKLTEEMEKARRYDVVPTSESVYKVKDGRSTIMVDLDSVSAKSGT